MTTSQTSFLSEILSGQPIPIGKLAYFRARLSNKIHELVLSEFMRLEQENKITKAELARRIGRKPEQVTRWLGAPGNWTSETFSDLLLGMGCEPALAVSSLEKTAKPIEPEQSELPNAPSPQYIPGMPAANDEPLRRDFRPFGAASAPGDRVQA